MILLCFSFVFMFFSEKILFFVFLCRYFFCYFLFLVFSNKILDLKKRNRVDPPNSITGHHAYIIFFGLLYAGYSTRPTPVFCGHPLYQYHKTGLRSCKHLQVVIWLKFFGY